MNARLVLLPGDGIGPEVTQAARQVLEAIATSHGHHFLFEEYWIGGAAIEKVGQPLPASSLEACQSAEAILLGAVGGPQWDDPTATVRPEQGLLALRKALKVYANLRPVRAYPDLSVASPLKSERLAGVDILLVRELTGGIYFGEPRRREHTPDGRLRAIDTMVYHEDEIIRVVDMACRLAAGRRGKVTSIDKANVLETSRLWRQVATQVAARHPDIEFEHQLVDSAAMRLITQPQEFDVIVTGNMFGDILADEASVLAASLGNLPSAALGDEGPGLYEPVHGSAPDIAGRGVANPIGAILSAAMLLRHSLGLLDEAQALESAVLQALQDGCRTADLGPGQPLSTQEMTEAILTRIV